MSGLPIWSCSFNGLTMGAADSPIQLVNVDGLLSLPDIRSSDLVMVQRDGLWAGQDYMNGRTITLTLQVFGETLDDFTKALTAIQAAFAPSRDEDEFRFWFPGLAGSRPAGIRVRTRKRSGPLGADFTAGTCTIVVELFATDAYINGLTPRTLTVTGTTDASPPVAILRHGGSVTARPVIKFTNCDTPKLQDTTTGDWFSVAYSGTFTVDSGGYSVTTDKGDDITGLVADGSIWPDYAFGDHRMALSVKSGSGSSAGLTWTEHWL
jgi:hypothetical protein